MLSSKADLTELRRYVQSIVRCKNFSSLSSAVGPVQVVPNGVKNLDD